MTRNLKKLIRHYTKVNSFTKKIWESTTRKLHEERIGQIELEKIWEAIRRH